MVLLDALAPAARAQVLVQPGSGVVVQTPPPLPLPPVDIPPIPQLGAPLQPNLKPLPRNSFGDRVVRCLDQGVPGLGPNARGVYVTTCANQ
jgi:hypothetical protein